jgi:predicted metal-binding membrane protein
MMNTSSNFFAGSILIYAGAYQLSPLKRTCLKHCQSPLGFLSHHWKPGLWGALRMGLHHGVYCLGCCVGLMAILFFGGIMNLYWIVGLAVLVILEKLLPFGRKIPYVTGPALIIWGLAFLARAWG